VGEKIRKGEAEDPAQMEGKAKTCEAFQKGDEIRLIVYLITLKTKGQNPGPLYQIDLKNARHTHNGTKKVNLTFRIKRLAGKSRKFLKTKRKNPCFWEKSSGPGMKKNS